jgi:hypothetical protein
MKTLLRSNPAVAVLVVLLLAAVAFTLAGAVRGFPAYRDIHLGTALHYAQHGLGLDRTMIVGFNANDSPTLQEFPLWQMLVALAFKAFGAWWGWANVVSMLLFATALYPLHRIASRWLERRHASWALVLFLSQPLVFRYFGLASTDGTSIAAALWFCHFGLRMTADRSNSVATWAGALVFGTLAALLKLPYFMATGLGLFFFSAASQRVFSRPTVSLGIVGLAVGAVFGVWSKYTSAFYDEALFPLVDLRLSNPEIVKWYFGDWSYRLNPANWIKGGWRILNALFGSFVIAGLAVLGGFKPRVPWFALCMIAGGIVTTMVFSHLVLHHSHYYLMFAAPMALLSANGLAWLEERLAADRPCLFAASGAALLALSLVQGLIGMRVGLSYDPYPKQVGAIIASHTEAGDKLVIQGGGWGGNLLLHSGRDGLSIWNTEFLENPENLAELKRRGFTKLVMASESPLLHALQRINPGSSGKQREHYDDHRTGIARGWPVLFQNDDVIIQQIP